MGLSLSLSLSVSLSLSSLHCFCCVSFLDILIVCCYVVEGLLGGAMVDDVGFTQNREGGEGTQLYR